MHLRILMVAAGLATASGAVSAQQMYRCGSTYSQTPCGPEATTRALPSGAAPDSPPGLSGFALCAAVARAQYSGPEPATARIQPVGSRRSEVVAYAGKPTAAHRFDLGIDAKTPYGVYSGVTPYSCWLSEDQRRVLQFGPTPN